VVGSNCTVNVAVGLDDVRVNGKVTPENEYPGPVIAAELTVTDAVPVELKVRDCVVAVPTATLPKDRLVELTPSVGVPPFNWMANVAELPPAVAVSVAVWVVDTEEKVAEKLAEDEPAATVTEEGTLTAELLLARPTANPPLAAAVLRETVHESVPDPDMVPYVHVKPVSTGMPVPLRLTVELPAEASLTTVN